MREHTLGVGITFAAMALVRVKAESVIETLRFRLGLGDKAFAVTLEKRQLIFRDVKVRHNRAAFVFGSHGDRPRGLVRVVNPGAEQRRKALASTISFHPNFAFRLVRPGSTVWPATIVSGMADVLAGIDDAGFRAARSDKALSFASRLRASPAGVNGPATTMVEWN
jgi:hypothetical protein